ncbi:hypothetical protein G7K_6578-t1 [Saitoella complicata NRRL Y-17804]|uniref:Uncharacterized protein n=1 Tax=Saitoella complicata (strain BCRC 22490 / CBS 7301 / JCM 7358 / NBRC 10748 / NRRL Y-17804) TaxID=698492 RepID=A0A0E9NRW7_SAICN|nr:hypothetical protein G7K_6578-t1 [Saitoella complicata NRRL Y-17804]
MNAPPQPARPTSIDLDHLRAWDRRDIRCLGLGTLWLDIWRGCCGEGCLAMGVPRGSVLDASGGVDGCGCVGLGGRQLAWDEVLHEVSRLQLYGDGIGGDIGLKPPQQVSSKHISRGFLRTVDTTGLSRPNSSYWESNVVEGRVPWLLRRGRRELPALNLSYTKVQRPRTPAPPSLQR